MMLQRIISLFLYYLLTEPLCVVFGLPVLIVLLSFQRTRRVTLCVGLLLLMLVMVLCCL